MLAQEGGSGGKFRENIGFKQIYNNRAGKVMPYPVGFPRLARPP